MARSRWSFRPKCKLGRQERREITGVQICLENASRNASWLADRVRCTRQQVSNIFRGLHALTPKKREAFARALGVKPEQFYLIGELGLRNGPTMRVFQRYLRLSPANRLRVDALINRLHKRRRR